MKELKIVLIRAGPRRHGTIFPYCNHLFRAWAWIVPRRPRRTRLASAKRKERAPMAVTASFMSKSLSRQPFLSPPFLSP